MEKITITQEDGISGCQKGASESVIVEPGPSPLLGFHD